MQFTDLDLHLLKCLDVLVQERHVTRAAERMEMSQSGMSAALGRLRRVFDDPILVRTPQGMELSEHAMEIAGAVRRALSELEMAVGRRGRFEPAESSAIFTVMASDYVGLMILPALVERLRVAAPGITLSLAAPDPRRVREALANAEVDLVIGFFHDIAEGLYQSTIATDALACVVRRPHPRVDGAITTEQYSRGEHIFYGTPPGLVSSIEVVLDRLLPLHGIERRIVLHIPSLGVMPRVIARSDLIATLPARLCASFAERLGLQVLPLPFPADPLPIQSVWHERLHENNAHRWLREQVREAAREIGEWPLPT
jgi:DNA-binding transcriptional LysR family regulator